MNVSRFRYMLGVRMVDIKFLNMSHSIEANHEPLTGNRDNLPVRWRMPAATPGDAYMQRYGAEIFKVESKFIQVIQNLSISIYLRCSFLH